MPSLDAWRLDRKDLYPSKEPERGIKTPRTRENTLTERNIQKRQHCRSGGLQPNEDSQRWSLNELCSIFMYTSFLMTQIE